MGLDVSHDCWSGAYSAFMRWRRQLAQAAGFPPLDLMALFWRDAQNTAMDLGADVGLATDPRNKWDGHLVRSLPISWTPFESDPLSILLKHSDYDGSIAHEHCKPIARRLAELIDKMPTSDPLHGNNTQRFIDGLLVAHEAGEDVEFH